MTFVDILPSSATFADLIPFYSHFSFGQFLLFLFLLSTVLHYSYKIYISFLAKYNLKLRNRLLHALAKVSLKNENDIVNLEGANAAEKKVAEIIRKRQQGLKHVREFFAKLAVDSPNKTANGQTNGHSNGNGAAVEKPLNKLNEATANPLLDDSDDEDEDHYVDSAQSSLSDGRFGQSVAVPFFVKDFMSDVVYKASSTPSRQVSSFMPVIHHAEGSTLVASSKRNCLLVSSDSQRFLDLSGSFGLNVFGYEKYQEFVRTGIEKTKGLEGVLAVPTELLDENVELLKKVSKTDKVSFHMSGTEGVMAALRLARFNTNRKYVVIFEGSYHGWYETLLQTSENIYEGHGIVVLKSWDKYSLKYIEYEGLKIAAVIVNPAHAFTSKPSRVSDSTLLYSASTKAAPSPVFEETVSDVAWKRQFCKELRGICTDMEICLIFDEVYSGFRLAYGGGAEVFGVQPDLIVYGKTLGGGMPIGVVCGKNAFMRKAHSEYIHHTADVYGTFSASPQVMGAMNGFLRYIVDNEKEVRGLYDAAFARFDSWTHALNERLFKELRSPVFVKQWRSCMTFNFRQFSHYDWMFQFYLRKENLHLLWSGSGKCLLNLAMTNDELKTIEDKIMSAARKMVEDGWWSAYNEKPIGTGSYTKIFAEVAFKTFVELPGKHLVAEIFKHKRIDDRVAHRHPVNQMFHAISSYITLFVYAFVALSLSCYGLTSPTGTDKSSITFKILNLSEGFGLCVCLLSIFVSQTIRQSGHFFFEKTPPVGERPKIGFNNTIKARMIAICVISYALSVYNSYHTELSAGGGFSLFWLLMFSTRFLIVFFVGCFAFKAMLLFHHSNLRLASLWLLKIATDPLTDIYVYRKSWRRVWYRYIKRAMK